MLQLCTVKKKKKKKDWQCYCDPAGSCHYQTYRSNVEALSRAVSAEGLLPLAWRSSLLVF